MSVLTVIAYVLIFAGVIIFAGAGVGVLKFRDAYMRASAVGTAAGLGVALITIGAVLTMPTPGNLVKAAVAVVLQLATSAVGSTIIARAAVNSGHAFSRDTDLSDLEAADAASLASFASAPVEPEQVRSEDSADEQTHPGSAPRETGT